MILLNIVNCLQIDRTGLRKYLKMHSYDAMFASPVANVCGCQYLYNFRHGLAAPVSLGLLIAEVSRWDSDTPQSVGLLWTSDNFCRRYPYLTTHNIHKRQTSIPPAGYEFAAPASELPQTYALDRSAAEIGISIPYLHAISRSEIC